MRSVVCLLLLGCLAATARPQDASPPAAVVWSAAAKPRNAGPFLLPESVDLASCDRIELSVRPTEEYDHIGVRFEEAARAASWFRVDRAPAGKWTTLSLPLRWFRAGAGAIPRWEDVRRISVTSDGLLKIRDLRLVAGAGPHAAYPGAADLRELAFPKSRSGRTATRGRFVLLTDDPAVRTDHVLGELGRMRARLLSEFPPVYAAPRPVVLLVFGSFESYDDFWLKYFLRCGIESPPQVARSGYSMAGFAATWRHEDETGSRPRYVHEAVHPLLAVVHGIANDGSWLQEGIAEREAWRSAGGRRRMATIQEGIADESGRERFPLRWMLSDSWINEMRHWHAALFVEWLMADEDRRARFVGYVADIRERAGDELIPVFEKRMGVTVEKLEQRWLRDMRKRYGDADDD